MDAQEDLFRRDQQVGEFYFFDHTAELGLGVTGATLAEVFALAAQGLFSVMMDIDTVEERQALVIDVTSPDVEALLVQWLNELLYHSEVEGVLLKRFDVQEVSQTHIRAQCYGEPINSQRHLLLSGVKAATYHMVQVGRNSEFYARVILDI